MFDLLKKKISGFVKGISEAVGAKEGPKAEIPAEEKAISAPVEPPAVENEIITPVETPATIIEKEIVVEAPKQTIVETPKPAPAETPKPIEKPAAETPKPTPVQKPVEVPKPAPTVVPKPTVAAKPAEAPKPFIAPAQKPAETAKPPVSATATPKAFTIPKPATIPVVEKKRDIAPDLGLFSKLKGMLTNQVEITESETRAMFDELEMALLESDVSPDTAQALVAELKKSLVGKKVAKSEVEKTINGAIASAITSVFIPAPDLLALAADKKARGEVLKIMFLGPNGAGKTTTIAKLSSLFKANGLDVVVSASDTFRAAAIEQAAVHADKIGVKLVKQSYGADPAAVAFDAIKHAQSVGAAVVLIDTAGRQETNRNLIEEMKKIDRVAKPDFKIFIGEALAGHVLVEQVKSFDAAVGVDGIILTKLDCDAKGGNSISIAHDAAKPIMFFGIGQEYGDLVPFDPGYIAAKVLEA
ncbi:MAG: signal recognition particle-docking protein FtsY [Candidatus Micrarchaeia archaeon]